MKLNGKVGENTDVGTDFVTISGKGDYAGFTMEAFDIVPVGTKITKLKKAKKAFTVTWKVQMQQVDGYQIRYSTSKIFKKNTKTLPVESNTPKAKKKCYVRVRPYKTNDGNYYSAWSNARKVKTT